MCDFKFGAAFPHIFSKFSSMNLRLPTKNFKKSFRKTNSKTS